MRKQEDNKQVIEGLSTPQMPNLSTMSSMFSFSMMSISCLMLIVMAIGAARG